MWQLWHPYIKHALITPSSTYVYFRSGNIGSGEDASERGTVLFQTLSAEQPGRSEDEERSTLAQAGRPGHNPHEGARHRRPHELEVRHDAAGRDEEGPGFRSGTVAAVSLHGALLLLWHWDRPWCCCYFDRAVFHDSWLLLTAILGISSHLWGSVRVLDVRWSWVWNLGDMVNTTSQNWENIWCTFFLASTCALPYWFDY